MHMEEKIDRLLSQMTLREKIGQLNQIPSPKADEISVIEEIREGKVGSFILATTAHAGNDLTVSPEAQWLDELQRVAVEESRLGIPILFGRDVIHGHHTVLPVPLASAASFDDALVEQCYRCVAKEAARDGVHWTFSPMLDLSRDPRWGRCVEGAGEDPYLASRMAGAIVRGFQGENLQDETSLAACAKHYIGYGASEGGRDYHRTEISDYTLRNAYLPAFRSAVENGVQTIMSSFNDISGQPVSTSRYLLTDLLRGELGFDGFVISDWCAIAQTQIQGVAENEKQAAELCIKAGLDMDMVDRIYLNHLEDLVESGVVDMSYIDDAVRHVLRVKFRLGLFEHPYIPRYTIDRHAHRMQARALARESMVLLKNEGDLLPLSKETSITLGGTMCDEKDNLQGTWCLDGRGEDVTSVREGISMVAPDCHVTSESPFQKENNTPIVLCMGERKETTGEARSVARLEITEEQLLLAKSARETGRPVVAVLFYARPVAIEALLPLCDAILWAWHPGTEAGLAVADLLFGEYAPSGKLPMTLPRCTGQIPIYYNHTSTARHVDGYYGDERDARNYEDCEGTPLYPFGYGMSYSHIEVTPLSREDITIPYEALARGERVTVSCRVKNHSERVGHEVVQLYLHDTVASMTRPVRELKAYQRVSPAGGEAFDVSLSLGFRELAFYNAKGVWDVEKGAFDLYLGTSSLAPRICTLYVE